MTAASLLRTLFRLCLVALVAIAGLWLFDRIAEQAGSAMTWAAIALVLLAYALLLAVPFMPGVELGFTLLMMRGAEVAPLVWLATVLGLALAYALGHWLPPRWLAATLRDIGLTRAAEGCERLLAQPRALRQRWLAAQMPRPLRPLARGGRYLLLAALLNLPGSVLVGGGGGIAMAAGLSRIFAPLPTLAVFALATSPIPLLVWLYGPDILPWTH